MLGLSAAPPRRCFVILHHPVHHHHVVHEDASANRVRIAARVDAARVSAELRLMFPHEAVLTSPIGCCHLCVYTDRAPASHVARHIAEHQQNMAVGGDAEPAPMAEGRYPTDDPTPDFFGYEKDTRPH